MGDDRPIKKMTESTVHKRYGEAKQREMMSSQL